jgi:hypothetical protein
VFHTLTAEILMQANNNLNGEMYEHVTICTTLNSLLIHIRYECTCEIKCRIAMAKAAFNKKRAPFYWHIGLGIEEEASEVLRLEHSFIWY